MNKLFLIASLLLLCACESYNDCTRKIINSEVSSSEKRKLHDMCIYEHEETLAVSQVDTLEGRAGLNKIWESSHIYKFEPSVKNNLSSIMITEIVFGVSVTEDGKESHHTLKSKVRIDPDDTVKLSFDDTPDTLRLNGDIEKGNWSWRVISAKGVNLR